MSINAKYIGQSTIQVSTSFLNGQSSSNLVSFMTFANCVADAMTGTQPLQVGSLSGVTFDAATVGVTAQTAALYSPTPSSNTGWTYYDAFWGGQDGTAGSNSPIYTQVFRSVNKDGITAKNIVLRYNTKEQVINATTYQYWDTQANYDNGTISTTAVVSPTATAPSGNSVITVSSATSIAVGQQVYGSSNVSPLTTVTAINGTAITLSTPIVGSLSSTTLNFANMLHTGTNEAWTYFDSAPVSYNLTACDLIINVSPRWCILHSYLFGEPTMWAGVVETAREDILDTPVAKSPCWGWVSSTLWALGASNISPTAATKSLVSGTGNDHTLISMPKTKIGNSGVAAAKGWGADYGVTSVPTWLANTAGPMIYHLGTNALNPLGKFNANAWDSSRRLTLPIKPIGDFGLQTVTNYGQIYGMKVLAPVGQNMNKINLAVDSDGNSNTAASDRSHWLLNCHYKGTDGNNYFTTTGITNAQWAVASKPLGMVSVGSMIYYFSATTIGKVDIVTGGDFTIISGQTGFTDIKYDGERYVYVTSSTPAIGIIKIDIANDNYSTTVTASWSSGGAVGASTFVVSGATGSIMPGQTISGTGLAAGTVVTAFNPGTNTVSISPVTIGAMQAGTITFTNTTIVSVYYSAAGYSTLAINGDTICAANSTPAAAPTFTRFVRQSSTGAPQQFIATANSVFTTVSLTDTVQVKDMTADFEGNFWAGAIFTTAANAKPIRIDRNLAAGNTLPTWSATIYPTALMSGINYNMIDGNNLLMFGTQTAGAGTTSMVQVNPRTYTVISNVVGAGETSATAAYSSGSYAKIQGNLTYLPRNSGASGYPQLIGLGRTVTNVLPAPILNADIVTTLGSTTTGNTAMLSDGARVFLSAESTIRYFTNFNGGTINGGNPVTGVTFGQVAIPG
jgi:hypothetical protein